MFLGGVSNYRLWPMEKTHFCILIFLVFLTSCNSDDYIYDDYDYNDYNYNDYDNQRSYDNNADYSQELNDYYDHNLLAPPNPPLLPPTPMGPMGKISFFS